TRVHHCGRKRTSSRLLFCNAVRSCTCIAPITAGKCHRQHCGGLAYCVGARRHEGKPCPRHKTCGTDAVSSAVVVESGYRKNARRNYKAAKERSMVSDTSLSTQPRNFRIDSEVLGLVSWTVLANQHPVENDAGSSTVVLGRCDAGVEGRFRH